MNDNDAPGWLPEEDRSTAWYIWSNLFECRIPYIDLVSEEELNTFGVPYIGIPQFDRQIPTEVRTVYINVARMVELFQNGTVVRVVNETDIVKIYDLISNHLNAWKNYMSGSLNNINAPIKDLIEMDEFANAVYSKAKYHFDYDFLKRLFSREDGIFGRETQNWLNNFKSMRLKPRIIQITGNGSNTHYTSNGSVINVGKMDGYEEPKPFIDYEPEKEEEKNKYPERDSMADFFDDHQKQINKHYRSNNSGINLNSDGHTPSSVKDLLKRKE